MSKKINEVAQKIKDRIYAGHYWPREQLIEAILAEEMSVSRTVIRDVLKELSVKGLVNILPHRGAFVAEMSYTNMKEILELEAVLESSAAYLATPLLRPDQIAKLQNLLAGSKKLDLEEIQAWADYNWQFHKVIITSCNNARLINMIKGNVQFVKYWFVQLSLPNEIFHRNKAHEEIFNAIEKRDASLVRQLMEEHLLFASDALLKRIKSLNPNFMQTSNEVSGL